MDPRLLNRIRLRNYKSIAACDVELGALSFLVGPNGSGKSNFLDALHFVADGLRHSLDHALRDRGGINEVRRRSGGHPNHFGLRLDFALDGVTGYYAFRIGSERDGAYVVQREECRIAPRDRLGSRIGYQVEAGEVTEFTPGNAPPAARDRLFLVNAAGFEAFRPVYDALSGMGFYNLSPDRIRDLQAPDPGELLHDDGDNLASVLARMRREAPERKQLVEDYLAKVVPGIATVEARSVGPRETLEFGQAVRNQRHPWHFMAANMSDGTLRALGVLVALFQHGSNGHQGSNGRASRRLVGIEEPEVALHPAAAGVLTEILLQAAQHIQVLVTSHSPDLLDAPDIPGDAILAVVAEQGETKIGPIDDTGRGVLREHLYTAGELLRMDQLRPDPRHATVSAAQMRLFESST